MSEALAREALHLLIDLTAAAHVRGRRRGLVELEMRVPGEVFDRLCLWDAVAEDLEEEPDAEDGGDAEEEDT